GEGGGGEGALPGGTKAIVPGGGFGAEGGTPAAEGTIPRGPWAGLGSAVPGGGAALDTGGGAGTGGGKRTGLNVATSGTGGTAANPNIITQGVAPGAGAAAGEPVVPTSPRDRIRTEFI